MLCTTPGGVGSKPELLQDLTLDGKDPETRERKPEEEHKLEAGPRELGTKILLLPVPA